MVAIASQITSLTIVYSTIYSDADERKHLSSASLAFVRGIHRWPVNSPRKWPVTRKIFPFDDVIMVSVNWHCHSPPYLFPVEQGFDIILIGVFPLFQVCITWIRHHLSTPSQISRTCHESIVNRHQISINVSWNVFVMDHSGYGRSLWETALLDNFYQR